ncbi:hypothetical protein PC9H_004979 [Pleurotus ostreatus]|uniref:TLC domain-containing protein n=1 Tax=Pleurotus ostreatus TaxID=5322 RepID=A0A8H6ZZM7_PLEOS|nr:uncharacterized protein PC9H_004979 [Pleurotus ostreatus]KAF7433033.1 hypothetical protein PC9H_004979 [Pleurotus ostreatus]KAJ8698357.1 sphingosine N-acyltransferase lag1 [Pleurotus ostreatus]
MQPNKLKTRNRSSSLHVLTNGMQLEKDVNHHLTGPFLPQTPLGSAASSRTASPVPPYKKLPPPQPSALLTWAIDPLVAFKILIVPVILYINWDLITPFVDPSLQSRNPFAPLFLLSHRVPASSEEDPRYQKGYLDLLFIAYYIVFWSCIRQIITVNICKRICHYFGIKKQVKIERFGEQGYAFVYFAFFGAWGFRIMSQLPSFWYRTEHFWLNYPHWDMKPELKCYYLVQMAYWWQQLIVMVLGLEKPRKDYRELVAHHAVTLWLVGWSYLVNLTFIGNAVYMSMDIPDTFLAFSKLLNYLQRETAKMVVFAGLLVTWSYFRLWLNLRILWSVWNEFDLIPDEAKQWYPESGAWLVWWMKYQIFTPLLLLEFLNLFWYYLILRIAYRAITTNTATDDRSDDEDEGDDGKED